jgi:integrase
LIFRSVDRGGHSTGKSMTARAIFEVAQGCGQKIGVPELAPHDLRRTFAKVAHKGRAGLEQIQLALVRVLIATNEP